MDGFTGKHTPPNNRVRKVEINPVPNVDTTEMDDRTEGEEIASERASVAFAKRKIAEILKRSIPLGKEPEPCISGGSCTNQEYTPCTGMEGTHAALIERLRLSTETGPEISTDQEEQKRTGDRLAEMEREANAYRVVRDRKTRELFTDTDKGLGTSEPESQEGTDESVYTGRGQ